MYLTREQEKILAGEYGWAYAKALEIIVKVGGALGAEKLIPITHAHVSGISYTNIGDPGLEFIRDFYKGGVKAKVYTTINPGCIDLLGSSRIISDEPRDKQLEINQYLERMGFKPTYTCIPYIHRRPVVDEHLAWGESSAVIFANSVFGARTNREGGPLALAAGLTGYTYYYGLHLLENRVAEVKIVLEDIEPDYYGGLGLWIGDNIRETPIIMNLKPSIPHIKLLLAAAAASGGHGLIVLNNLTPPKTYSVDDSAEKIHVDKEDIMEYTGSLSDIQGEVIGYIGCPHLDPFEFEELFNLIKTHEKLKKDYKLLVSIPRIYADLYRDEILFLKKRGVDVVVGTCPIVSILRDKPDYIVTNSGKAAFYLKRLHGIDTVVAPLNNIIEILLGDQ